MDLTCHKLIVLSLAKSAFVSFADNSAFPKGMEAMLDHRSNDWLGCFPAIPVKMHVSGCLGPHLRRHYAQGWTKGVQGLVPAGIHRRERELSMAGFWGHPGAPHKWGVPSEFSLYVMLF